MRVPRLRFTVRRMMVAVAMIAVGLGLWISVPMLGFVLWLVLVYSGSLNTRIGRELAYVLVNAIGVEGLNTSGRPDDDPFTGRENFPWLLLLLVTLIFLVGAMVLLTRMRMEIRRPRKSAVVS
jgi:hypothetical protein